MLDVGRHVGSPYDQQAHIVLGRRNDQFTALVRVLGRHNTGLRQQRQGIVENPTFG
ncbi:hypothetical protein D3C81_1943540 [compost metagenome]